MEGIIGEIRMFAGSFAPMNWALCQGQILSAAQNAALFSVLGATYGGDGKQTFALPDLRGRVPMGVAPDRSAGDQGGGEIVTPTRDGSGAQSLATLGMNFIICVAGTYPSRP